jgi:hypothetical protein
MMQRCTCRFICKIIQVPLVGQYNYHTNGTKNNRTTEELQGNDLICSVWEEAIIKEQRMPDIPFDSMQKDTIAQLHNDNQNHKNSNQQQSNLKPMMKSSN